MKEFEAGDDFRVVAKDDSPENVKAAEMAARALAELSYRGDEWRVEAFRAAQAEAPGRWPSYAAVITHFERIARAALTELANASPTDTPESDG